MEVNFDNVNFIEVVSSAITSNSSMMSIHELLNHMLRREQSTASVAREVYDRMKDMFTLINDYPYITDC